MANTIDVRPQEVDVLAYAGDTLSIKVTAPAALVDGMLWHASIKSKRSATTSDAVFDVTPPTVAGGPAYLVLTGEESLRLMGILAAKAKDSPQQQAALNEYVGHWDCQISASLDDPIRTLVQGKITIYLDVTRA